MEMKELQKLLEETTEARKKTQVREAAGAPPE